MVIAAMNFTNAFQSRRHSCECIFPPSEFLHMPPSQNFLKDRIRTVPGNMHVKFEVHSFNHFGAISI